MEKKPEFVEEIEENICTNFKVTKIPVKTLRKFKKLCKEKCGDVYWVGIEYLLDYKEKYDQIVPLLSSIQKELTALKETKGRKEIKTFG